MSDRCLLRFLAALHPSNNANVSRGRICSDKCMCFITEIELGQFAISPSHSILTPGRPVPALTLYCQAPGIIATGLPIV